MRPGGTLKPTTVLHSSALRSASPVSVRLGTRGHSRLSTPYSTITYRLVSVSADLLGVCGRSDCHSRRAQGRMAGPQARAPLPPIRWRGSGSGPLADGTPPSPRNRSHVHRADGLSVAGADVAAARRRRRLLRGRTPAAQRSDPHGRDAAQPPAVAATRAPSRRRNG